MIVRLASVAVVAAAVSVVPWHAAATVTAGPPVAWVVAWAAAQLQPDQGAAYYANLG